MFNPNPRFRSHHETVSVIAMIPRGEQSGLLTHSNRLRENGINRSCVRRGDERDRFDVIVRAPLDIATKDSLGGDRSWFSKVLKAAMEASTSIH